MTRRNNMSNKQLLTAIQKLTTTLAKPQPKKRKQRARKPKVVEPSDAIVRRNAALPAAYTSHVKSRFRITSRTADTVMVEGCDLVYPIPSTVEAGDDTIFTVIPCNPAYWTGTRIGQIAPAYMNYRPISMQFSYIPQVAVTQPGTVIMGTLWNGAAGSTDLQQTLFTSNGGMMTQCYVPADTSVKLGAALPQNLFQMNGALRPESNPFIFIAALRGGNVVPGYFYVHYQFALKNPVGSAWNYMRSDPTIIVSQPMLNTAAVLLESLSVAGYAPLGPGSILDVDDGRLYYHGTLIDGEPNIILFSNEQLSTVTGGTAEARIDRVTGGNKGKLYYCPIAGNYVIPNNKRTLLLSNINDQVYGWIWTPATTTTIQAHGGEYVYQYEPQVGAELIDLFNGTIAVLHLTSSVDIEALPPTFDPENENTLKLCAFSLPNWKLSSDPVDYQVLPTA